MQQETVKADEVVEGSPPEGHETVKADEVVKDGQPPGNETVRADEVVEDGPLLDPVMVSDEVTEDKAVLEVCRSDKTTTDTMLPDDSAITHGNRTCSNLQQYTQPNVAVSMEKENEDNEETTVVK